MIIKRAFRFRILPTAEQLQKFQCFAGACRWIYNRGLQQRIQAYQNQGKTLSYFEQNIELPKLKKDPETCWLKEIHSQVLQQSLKNLDRAYTNFFRRLKTKEKPGFPRFKKKGIKDSFRFPQGVKIKDNQVFLPKIGWVKFKKTRDVPETLNETTITQESGKWYISFSCEWQQPDPAPVPICEARAVGIDLGLQKFATLSIGKDNQCKEEANPRHLKNLLIRLKKLSRCLSKKIIGSRNRFKARLKLSGLYARIKNLRQDYLQKLSTEMVKNHDIFCIEDLDIAGLLQKKSRHLARNIADAGWRYFLHCLKYKAEQMGKHVVKLNRYFASSQICSSCGNQQEMPLSERKYHCINCRLKIDRDYNSAISLKAAGMSVLKACGAPSGS